MELAYLIAAVIFLIVVIILLLKVARKLFKFGLFLLLIGAAVFIASKLLHLV